MNVVAARRSTRRVGRFALLEELGRGAQATVWRAHDEKLDRDVALKLLNPDADVLAVSQWLHEARAVSRLAHPHIVPVFEADDAGGQPYLVFELVKGGTLTEQLRRGAMSPQAATQVMTAVLDALAAAHTEGIVHRDLKPSNILIDAGGRPRVMDFGIAARVADGADGRIVGTPGYMSPEAARGAPPTAAMDVFSAGMVLAEMLGGRPLLRERDPMLALRRVCSEDFALPETVECPDPLRAVVRRALARDATQRFATALAFKEALTAAMPPLSGPKEGSGDGANATLDFLLRRMRHKSDFPALSESVTRIQRIATSETENLNNLTDEILKDVALTHKLLRIVNTAHFSHVGGKISTVSRAVALIGFAGIRNMALSLVLLDHMQDKTHAARLKEEFAGALMAGQLASELAPRARDAEEIYLAALLQNLGRLLTEFYFPEEARTIRELLQAPGMANPPTAAQVDSASARVLGIGFEALGSGVAKSWGLPESLQRAMRRTEGDAPSRHVENPAERMRWLASMSNDMAQTLLRLEPEVAERRVQQIAHAHSKALGMDTAVIRDGIDGARQRMAEVLTAMGLRFAAGSAPLRLLTPDTQTLVITEDLAATAAVAGQPAEQQATVVLPRAEAVDTEPPKRDADEAAQLLTSGIQDVSETMASESFRLNEVLRMILEALYRALGLRRVVFCLRDPRTQRLTGRFSLGEDTESLVRRFDVPLVVSHGQVPDLFCAVCQKHADTLISDANEEKLRARLPAWFRDPLVAPTFLLLPLAMKGSTFALIYGDSASAGGIVIGHRELALVKTLRNQAVMAFKQAG